jgi:hypothetical protein
LQESLQRDERGDSHFGGQYAGWLGRVRLTFRKYRYTRPKGKFSAVAWSCRHAERTAGRAAKIIIDDLDALKATATCLLHKVVLATFALQVHLDLSLRGLAYVDDGLAAQHIGGKQFMV